MVANYKNVQHEKVYLLNDDEQSCYDLVNAKMVPILQLDNGTAMGESLDIVAKLDEVGDTSKVIAPKATGDEIDAMFAAIKTSTRILTYPRTILIGLPEFATQSACDYFQAKKEKMIEMSFAQAMMMSEKHIEIVNQVLATLPSFSINAVLSMDDILTFPILRNLSMVKGVVFTANTLSYIQHIAALTRSETYFAKAI